MAWMHLPPKADLASSSSPELEKQQCPFGQDLAPALDTSAPGTPMRVSSSSKSSSALQTRYSQDDETNEDQLAIVQPLQRFAAASLAKQQSSPQEQLEEWTATRQAAAVVVACLTWVVISSATILINKHIMVDLS